MSKTYIVPQTTIKTLDVDYGKTLVDGATKYVASSASVGGYKGKAAEALSVSTSAVSNFAY